MSQQSIIVAIKHDLFMASQTLITSVCNLVNEILNLESLFIDYTKLIHHESKKSQYVIDKSRQNMIHLVIINYNSMKTTRDSYSFIIIQNGNNSFFF